MPDLSPQRRPNPTIAPPPEPEFTGSLFETLASTGIGFPVERDVITAIGADAATYLQGQLSQDVESMAEGDSAWSLLLQPQGKLAALVLVTRMSATSFALATEPGAGADALARLLRFKLRVDCELTLATRHGIALRGVGASSFVANGSTNRAELLVARFRWAGIDGVDVLGAESSSVPELPDGVPDVGADGAEYFRIAVGFPRAGVELDEKTNSGRGPASSRCRRRLRKVATSAKSSLLGSTPVATTHAAHLVRMAADAPVGADEQLHLDGETVGYLTSVVANPDGGVLALGYLMRKAGDAELFIAAESVVPVRLLGTV
ncbi:MAG: hypothetical protein R2706_18990 [Acidimicrobiales bacterium]